MGLRQSCKIVVGVWMLAAVALAQQTRVYREGGTWAEEVTGSLAAARNLRIKVDVGSVRVQGGSQPGISYVIRNRAYTSSEDRARREFDAYKISAYVRGDTAYLTAEWEGGSPHRFSGEFSLNVPRELEWVKIETDGGSVMTNSVAGRVDAQSGGGSIRMDDIGGGISAVTGGGSIEVGKAGGDLSLHTGGGSIRVSSAKGTIQAETGGGSVAVLSGEKGVTLETGGGSIQVERCAGRLKVSTGGGSIDLGNIAGPADIETGGGSIRVISATGAVRAATGGGSIELNGVPSARAETGAGGIVARFIAGGERDDSLLETAMGDITVYLVSGLNLTIRASIEVANGHEIRSDFPEIRVSTEGGDYGPKTVTAEGNLNGGGPILKVRTTTGDIRFLRVGR